MATNNYTTKTAALRATKADINKLDAKRMLLNGKNIEELWGLNLPDDYKKFITRCELPEDENWAIWDDNGNLLYMNFSDKIINGSYMFYGCSNLSLFSYDLSSLTVAERMFQKCSNLSSFTSDLSSLTNGNNMFSTCSNLTTFTSDLSSLTSGTYMFYSCTNLSSFESDLSSLTVAERMFQFCSNLSSFESDLSSLTEGTYMFSGCSNLTTFTSDLTSLSDGSGMFSTCSNLSSFESDLSSLTNGNNMFSGCILDSNSIENILTTIPTLTNAKTLTIGIRESAASKFAEITGLTPSTTEQTVSYKGWNVKVKIND